MQITILDTPQVSASFDDKQHLIIVAYCGVLSPEVTTMVYQWLDQLLDQIGSCEIRGRIFDFSRVTQFAPDNLSSAQREIRNLNINHDLSTVPAAMIVETFQQEQMVDLTLRFSPRVGHKRIVHSMEQALDFITLSHPL